jgi:hypothetical protein
VRVADEIANGDGFVESDHAQEHEKQNDGERHAE